MYNCHHSLTLFLRSVMYAVVILTLHMAVVLLTISTYF